MMRELLMKAADGMKSKLKKVGSAFLDKREVSIQDVVITSEKG